MVQNRALRDRMTEPPFSTIFADGRVAGFLIYQVGLAMRALVCLTGGGPVLVRPDGFIGFRAVPADRAGMNALDVHLASYLVPVPMAAARTRNEMRPQCWMADGSKPPC
jgi:hypothetical protein